MRLSVAQSLSGPPTVFLVKGNHRGCQRIKPEDCVCSSCRCGSSSTSRVVRKAAVPHSPPLWISESSSSSRRLFATRRPLPSNGIRPRPSVRPSVRRARACVRACVLLLARLCTSSCRACSPRSSLLLLASPARRPPAVGRRLRAHVVGQDHHVDLRDGQLGEGPLRRAHRAARLAGSRSSSTQSARSNNATTDYWGSVDHHLIDHLGFISGSSREFIWTRARSRC